MQLKTGMVEYIRIVKGNVEGLMWYIEDDQKTMGWIQQLVL